MKPKKAFIHSEKRLIRWWSGIKQTKNADAFAVVVDARRAAK